jgi:hypothetical protein
MYNIERIDKIRHGAMLWAFMHAEKVVIHIDIGVLYMLHKSPFAISKNPNYN